MALARNCDLHMLRENKAVPATYDAKTKAGPWGYLCDEHMESDADTTYRKAATKLADAKGVD